MKMAAALCFLSIIPYLCFQTFYHKKIKKDISDSAYSLLESVVDSQVGAIYNQLSNVQNTLLLLDSAVGETLDLDHLSEFRVLDKQKLLNNLNDLAQISGAYSYLGIINCKESFIYVSGYGIGNIKSSRFAWLETYAIQALSQKSMMILPAFGYHNGSGVRPYCAFLSPLNYLQQTVAMCLVDMEELLRKQRQEVRYSQMTFSLLNEEGEVLFGSEETREIKELQIERKVGLGQLRLRVSIPQSELFSSVNRLSNILTAVTALMVLLVLFIALVLSRLLYRPIQTLSDQLALENVDGKNEFEFFQKSYRLLQQEYQGTVQSREDALHRLRQTQFLTCINRTANRGLDNNQYGIVVLSEKSENFFRKLENALKNSEFLSFSQRMVVVWETTLEDYEQELRSFKATEGLIGAASKPRGFDGLFESYAEASFLLEMGILAGCPDTGLFELSDSYDVLSDGIYEEIRQWSFSTREEFGDLLEALFPGDISEEVCRQRLFAVLALLRQMDRISFEQMQELADNLASLRNHVSSRDAVQLLLQSIGVSAVGHGRERNHAEKEQQIQELNRYICKHYADPLSLDNVSEAIGVSRQKVCELMREAHGITFVNYLNQFRVEKAKILLGETTDSLEVIRTATGFSSNSYFIRVFKVLTGLTPGEYRKFLFDSEERKT